MFLYSADQAERLREKLHDAGITDINLVPLADAGVMDVLRETKRGPTPLTPEQRQAKEAKRRDQTRKRVAKHRRSKTGKS